MKKIKRFIGFVLLAAFAFLGVVFYNGYKKYKTAVEENPPSAVLEQLKCQEHYTPIELIPEFYKNAVVAVEDRRFYYHSGIDPIGIARAVITDIKEKKLAEGGSSITQQLAKNIYYPSDYTATRKIAEMFTALRLEKEYSKDEILEMYFNVIYYGRGYYNIYDAAKGYFGKEPAQMSEYECTLLAGLPNAPSVYSSNASLASLRQDKVISAMVECRYITKEDGEKIKAE